jgi:hypothetical protein
MKRNRILNINGVKEGKRKRKFGKDIWKKMINDFEGNKGRKYIFRKTWKERWKIMKHDSILRRNNYKLQKSHINYCLNLSNISSDI